MATSALGFPTAQQPVDVSNSMAGRGLVRVVSNAQLNEQDRMAVEAEEAAKQDDQMVEDALASYIRKQMQEMRNFRNAEGISERLLHALRTYKGQYDPATLQEIEQFGGSNVYARVTATKCRAATALLRDVYLGAERPWDIDPTPDPEVPLEIESEIQKLVNIEVSTLMQSGQPVDEQMVADRVQALRKGVERAARKMAIKEADVASRKLDDILTEGGFYEALAEFLIDLPIFPYACIKGPIVRRVHQTKWVNGQPVREAVLKMFWDRVSPFDLYWTPGAAKTRHADFVERIQLARAELREVRDLPGYNKEAIDEVLERAYMDGLHEWWDTIDTERAEMEDREQWGRTSSSLIDTAEFTGYVSGRLLRDWGMSADKVPDPSDEFFVTAWMIDRWVIKVQINKSTKNRPPYYLTSFEKVPGALVGQGLPDLLEDVQTVCNASVRSLVNNASISSGPQVVINDFVLDPGDDDELYPWKRWHYNVDPAVDKGAPPVNFFQPNINSGELMGIYEKFNMMGDEISAIPRYMTGNEKVGGAGRTASGLAMLMGNASKTLQNVAASVDREVIGPLLHELFDMIMLTMPGEFKGDELIVVKGVNHAVKREQDRMRQLEFLQLTANPIDMNIVGVEGRANILRSVAQNLGLEHERTVPDDDELRERMAAQAAAAQMQQPGAGQPDGGGDPNQQPGPQDERAGPEAVREEVEGDFTGPTGRPGMRAGG